MADSPFNIVTSSKPKKGSKGLIVAVIVVVFLILSVVAGVLLVRQRQNIQEKAQVQPLGNTVTFSKAGKIRIYYHDYSNEGNYGPMLMRFKLGNQDAQDALIPGNNPTAPAKMEIFDTAIEVAAGDTYTVAQYYGGSASSGQPSLGWLNPSAGKCGAPGHLADAADKIAYATAQAQGEPLVSQQCWADWLSNPSDPSAYDYNDFFTIISYVPAAQSPSPSPSISPSPSTSPSGNASPSPSTSPSPTTSSSPKGTASPTATSGSSAQTTPRPIPETGVDWPSMAGIGVGAVAIILAILLAL